MGACGDFITSLVLGSVGSFNTRLVLGDVWGCLRVSILD